MTDDQSRTTDDYFPILTDGETERSVHVPQAAFRCRNLSLSVPESQRGTPQKWTVLQYIWEGASVESCLVYHQGRSIYHLRAAYVSVYQSSGNLLSPHIEPNSEIYPAPNITFEVGFSLQLQVDQFALL